MSILVQEINNRILSALDAEGSDRYLFDQDIKPAVNYSIEFIVSVFNKGFAENKLSAESLRELVKIGIWQANNFSRIAFDSVAMGHKLWTTLAVYPEIVTHPFYNPTPNPNPAISSFMPGLSYVSGKGCTNRLTFEEWNDNQENIFMPGNNTLSGALVDYAYLDFADYTSSAYANPGVQEITIRPTVANKLVALGYLKRPTSVSLISDSVQFPDALINIIMDKALMFISTKQGDGTNLYSVSTKDVQQIAALLS